MLRVKRTTCRQCTIAPSQHAFKTAANVATLAGFDVFPTAVRVSFLGKGEQRGGIRCRQRRLRLPTAFDALRCGSLAGESGSEEVLRVNETSLNSECYQEFSPGGLARLVAVFCRFRVSGLRQP